MPRRRCDFAFIRLKSTVNHLNPRIRSRFPTWKGRKAFSPAETRCLIGGLLVPLLRRVFTPELSLQLGDAAQSGLNEGNNCRDEISEKFGLQ